ncbi:MAG TPA: CBS domain-containing protein [Acidimicrobiales bacterium]|jgi:signal-transduction protein with cAMP-binding, CBS, and nucleotidyltransferase domain|nr:CBS domain-containing protein [Acidimicrobiales bacterium]
MITELLKIATIPAVTCPETAPISQASRAMAEHGVGCVVVVDADKHVTGMLTDRDIAVRAVGSGKGPKTAVSEVMSRSVVSVGSNASTLDAVRQMAARQCRRLPVVDETGGVLGVVSLDDLFRAEGEIVTEMNRLLDTQWQSHRRLHLY